MIGKLGVVAVGAGAVYAVVRVQEALSRLGELDDGGWREQLEHDMDYLEDNTRQGFEALVGRVQALENGSGFEAALEKFAQHYLVAAASRRRGQDGEQGPQG